MLSLNFHHMNADDYVWGEEFIEGDLISATTFNQIFDTLQKLNRTPVDADLIGTWSCSAVEKMSNTAESVNGWSQQGFLWVLPAKQVTLTSSGDNSSMISPYSLSTEAPSPFYVSNNESIGTYSLFSGMLFLSGVSSVSGVDQYYVDVVSDDRFVLQGVTSGGTAVPDFIICDSAIAVPATPTTAIATNAQTTVNLSWTDQSSDETGFKIYRRLSTETEVTQLATAVVASPYVDSTLTEGQTAYYSVSAYNANGESAKSKTVSATLDSIKPTVVSTSPTNGGSTTGTTVTINFSETIRIKCLDETLKGVDEIAFCSDRPAVKLVGEGGSGNTYYMGDTGFTGSILTASPFVDGANSSYTVTINSDNIYDLNGNKMVEDYVFTFTDN